MLAVAQGGPPGGPPPPQAPPALSGFSVIPFNFGPPGARSLGMGGTFLAIADDATASESNPAGLIKLSRPELSLHLRHSDFSIEAVDINAVAALGDLNTARGPEAALEPGRSVGNAFAESVRTRFDDSVSEPSFVSYVEPLRHWTFSIFFQRSAAFAGNNRFTAYDDIALDVYRTRQELDLDLENLGISAAFRLGPRIALGFSARASRLRLSALQETRVDFGNGFEFEQLEAGVDLATLEALSLVDQQINRESPDDEDTTFTWNAGLLINPDGAVSFGLVYKEGGSFEIDGQVEEFSCFAMEISGRVDCQPPPMGGMRSTRRIEVPDFYGAGITWRATPRFRLALDVNRITYSELSFGRLENPNTDPGRQEFEDIEDATEVHLGLEYIFFVGSGGTPLTVRAGAYTDPDHDGFRRIDSEETVLTFGLGTVLMEKFQIDVAGQFSDRADVAILSMVYRF